MGKKGKKAQAGKPKKLTPKDIGKRMDALVKKLEEELDGADLFAPIPPTEDCAICFVRLPRTSEKIGKYYQACCGKDLCGACYKENEESIKKQKNAGKKVALTCPFCREPEPTSGPEYMQQVRAKCEVNHHVALTLMGNRYQSGEYESTPKDELKALDCWIRAVENGSTGIGACGHIADAYNNGRGVAVNKERGFLFYRAGALRGEVTARYNVGLHEYYDFGNHDIGIRHWKIAAEAGDQESLIQLRDIYNAEGEFAGKEFISKEEMDTIYRSGHGAQMEVKSVEREKHSKDDESMVF